MSLDDIDDRKLIGYQIFYKRVDQIDPNIHIYDDRAICNDTWQSQFYDLDRKSQSSQQPPDDDEAEMFRMNVTANIEANSM